uniref:CARD domain-containing protein n=2 Tax=Sparus aurata TaxID=8175 RepID=A0A671VP86_SPAAU
MVQDQEGNEVWKRELYLTGPTMELEQRNIPAEDSVPEEDSVPAEDSIPEEDSVPADDSIPAKDRLLLVRSEFVRRVSEPVLNQLLDKLLEGHVINDEEMQSATTKTKAAKARDVIDNVRRKGTEASSVLIAALCDVDPCLSRVLNLRRSKHKKMTKFCH